ncbi:MAG: hypothetical protein A3K65_04190 [Euryarchaeota archaeon RBG_16_68_12]|nr:MAG: hypothetical protein A3K65_04190 [Euryarchaeota archaeon RBG_16_68_12]
MPAKPRSYVAVVKATEGVLRACRIDHVFVGGLAVLAFGEPRTVTDVDVVAAYGPGDAAPLVQGFLRSGFLASPEGLRDALTDGAHCIIEDGRSRCRVDLSAATTAPAKDAIAARQDVRWRGMTLPIAGPEHTIVTKLAFGKEQDFEDALGIYRRQQARLDVERMRGFARERGVLEELDGLGFMAGVLAAERPEGRGPEDA